MKHHLALLLLDIASPGWALPLILSDLARIVQVCASTRVVRGVHYGSMILRGLEFESKTLGLKNEKDRLGLIKIAGQRRPERIPVGQPQLSYEQKGGGDGKGRRRYEPYKGGKSRKGLTMAVFSGTYQRRFLAGLIGMPVLG